MTQEIKPLPPQERPRHAPPELREEPSAGFRLLWGRIALLVVALTLAFLLGRESAPDPSADALRATREELASTRQEVRALQAQIAAQPTPEATEAAPPEATETTEPEEAEVAEPPAGKGETYVVKPGDTLRSIAFEFYENAALDGFIARANGIDDAADLRPGMKLDIPARPEL